MSDKLAFPVEDTQQFSDSGMTLRDYFAAKAMQAIISNPQMVDCFHESTPEWISRNSYLQADAMMKARQTK